MRAQVVRTPPGTGKTHSLARAIAERGQGARIVTGTTTFAAEMAADYTYVLIEGRNPQNCQRYEVVKALGERGHEVEKYACGSAKDRTCPAREGCLYWQQFEQPGTRVGAAEQLFNPHFLLGANLVVVDDADLGRTLVERIALSPPELATARESLKGTRRKALRGLLIVLAQAVLDLAASADGKFLQESGARVWDRLARAAKMQGHDIADLIAALPKRPKLPEPEKDAAGVVSREAAEAAPPALLKKLLLTLKEELPYFLSGEDFNSRLRVSPNGIELWRLRDHVRGRHGQALIGEADLLVLDATPVPKLVDHLTQHHDRLPDVEATVRLPENVSVVVYATSTNGHTVLRAKDRVEAVLGEIAAERQKHPTDLDKEAVVCFRAQKKDMVAAGFLESQVVTFGSVRGTNALAKVERLHLMGRPMPPGDDLVYLAQVLHFGEEPVSGQIALERRAYGAQPYEVDIFGFKDPRVQELLKSEREDEVEQAIHRARLFDLDQPQLRLVGGDEVTARRQVRVAIHTSHPVPGLRVDELVLTSPATDVNAERHEDSINRIEAAIGHLQATDQSVTTTAVTALAGASRTTVAKALRALRTGVHTPKRDLLNKGVYTLPQTEAGEPLSAPAQTENAPTADPAELGLCRGGCGKPMPAGHMCFDCASRSAAEWARQKKRRRSA